MSSSCLQRQSSPLVSLQLTHILQEHVDSQAGAQLLQRAADAAGVSLGPIGLTIGSDLTTANEDSQDDYTDPESIATLSTEEWRSKYEQDGYVDLWVEEEFNSGSRLIGGRAVHFGGHAGQKSGEGPGESTAPRHKVKIFNKFIDQEIEVEVPEDKYILYEAEDQGLVLPYACRLGCCTACAVKVLDGELYQPQSLGISAALKERGYALMCVGYPLTDLVLETVDEDEIYDLQFGKNFEEQATDPNSASVLRDDYAIELALLDE
jgi:ferredoxin